MNQLVIGMGQIGTAVKEVTESAFYYDPIFDDKKSSSYPQIDGGVDVMHICFPYTKDFVTEVESYINDYDPKHVVVWATVPIGTCRRIGYKVVHSPVEGIHPNLVESIRKMKRFVGWNNGAEGRFFVNYFSALGMSTSSVSSTETTELLKLRSTAKYGVNLVWAQYEAKLCKQFGVAYTDLMAYDRAYNELYDKLGVREVGRYVLYPPEGEIGGHCVVPNAKLLNEQFPSDLLDKIINMEKK